MTLARHHGGSVIVLTFLMALLTVWYVNFFDAPTVAVLAAFARRLRVAKVLRQQIHAV